MLRQMARETESRGSVTVREAAFPAPFPAGLEYSSPARGCWNIAHTGMLIPEAHEIFICGKGCLRGVVLTAAEMGAMDRYSAVEVREENLLKGNIESLMIGGVSDVLRKLPYKPRAVLVYVSCQQFFLGYDQQYVYRSLREQHPDIDFLDCYMIPTLRKSGITPDQLMRRQLYRLLGPREKKEKTVNLIGSNLPVCAESELVSILRDAGWTLQSIHACRTYDEYQKLAEASCNLFYEPAARKAAEDLKRRLGQDFLYLPFVYQADRLKENYRRLRDFLMAEDGTDGAEDIRVERNESTVVSERYLEAEEALSRAREVIKDTPVTVDYTFTFRILSFARMLLEHGFHVTELFLDAFLPEEKEDFTWIREHYPELRISPTAQPQMRFLNEPREKVLAVGQKAAYFCRTDYFVNAAESGGYYGFDGIVQIAELMTDAYLHPKDRERLIQQKGYGCSLKTPLTAEETGAASAGTSGRRLK